MPKRGDLTVVLNISLLHMVAFAALVAVGLQFISAGRSVVLGYTAPLWVVPGARLFLGERITAAARAGVGIGVAGLALMFNPLAFDWSDSNAVLGNGLILLGAFCWAVEHSARARAHLDLHAVPAGVLGGAGGDGRAAGAGASVEGPPRHIDWNPKLVGLFLFASIFGVVVAYWAMATVNRSLPAVTTSLGILATPVVGTLGSAIALGEPIGIDPAGRHGAHPRRHRRRHHRPHAARYVASRA